MPEDFAEFARQARQFLDTHAERAAEHAAFRWGVGDDTVAYLSADPPEVEERRLRAARDWQRTRYENGFGWISGPPEYGGQGLSPVHQLLYDAVEADYDVPDTGTLSVVGLGMIGPTILAHGQPAIKERYLPAMYRGDVIACQLFSEPEAGSDLASLQTRAVPMTAAGEVGGGDGSWTGRRSGRRWRSTARSGWHCAAPTRTRRSTRASPRSWWTWARPGWTCGRCAR